MKIRVAFVIGQYPPEERKLREQVALSYVTPEIEIGILSTPASPYIRGMSPTDIQMAAPLFIEAFREAERQGYDAVVPLGMLDLGIDGGKSAVNIPVVGPFEASFHVASLLGDRFGLIVYHPRTIPLTRAMARRYQMESKIAGIRSVGFALPDIAANRDQMVQNFVAHARALIQEDGAEVITFGCSDVFWLQTFLQKRLHDMGWEVPVLEGYSSAIVLAKLFVDLGVDASGLNFPSERPKRWRRKKTF